MSNNQEKLLNLIRESQSPDKALLTATKIILEILKQPVSSAEQAPVGHQTHD
jgi:hypothetical protein